jgi:hypothetical protein
MARVVDENRAHDAPVIGRAQHGQRMVHRTFGHDAELRPFSLHDHAALRGEIHPAFAPRQPARSALRERCVRDLDEFLP